MKEINKHFEELLIAYLDIEDISKLEIGHRHFGDHNDAYARGWVDCLVAAYHYTARKETR